MELKSLSTDNQNVIQAYGEGGFRIMNRLVEGSIILFPNRIVSWPLKSIDCLKLKNLKEVLCADPVVELLLVGCGKEMVVMPSLIIEGLRDGGVVVESMSTGAACRTYNLLLAEGRSVAAALIAKN